MTAPDRRIVPRERSSHRCFFYADAAPPDLHSSPTRRSSDLADQAELGGVVRRPAGKRVLAREAADRSEEHTSELQSPYDLVCPLLLEKKNRRRSTPSPWPARRPFAAAGLP